MNQKLKYALRGGALVTSIVWALMIEPSAAHANIEGYTEIDGYLFEDQWLADNVNETDYSPLLHANTLYLQVSDVVRRIDAFKLKDSYCLPPDRPLKSWDRDDLNEFVEDLKSLDRWYGQLGPLAAMAPLSDEADTYGVHAQLVSEVIAVKISGSLVKVYDMLLQLSSKPEIDCSPPPPPSHSSAALDPEPDLLGALHSAQNGNPYRSRPEINLPLGEDPAELVHEAEYNVHERLRDVRRNERRLDRESRERRARDAHRSDETSEYRNTRNRSANSVTPANDVEYQEANTGTRVSEPQEDVQVPSETPASDVSETPNAETQPAVSTRAPDIKPIVLRIPSEPSISVPRETNVPATRSETAAEVPVVEEWVPVEVPNNGSFKSGNFETRLGTSLENELELETRTGF